jgi:hypothetical protein
MQVADMSPISLCGCAAGIAAVRLRQVILLPHPAGDASTCVVAAEHCNVN